ncbi:MAG: glycosyltransferase family 2 protein [Propionibacteriaceae bacterium]|jgi:GT2 family glycosyltransferase|nr:glycosyltransferase family 2 protein [Propionibacteriaceae bacterium]
MTPPSPAKVAFLVVTWNNHDIVADCLESLLAQTGVVPVVHVWDNASADATPAVVRRYPAVRLTVSKTNDGFARGNNELIRQALLDPAVEYLALVNSDARLDPAWASTLVDFARTRSGVGALQGLTLDYYDHRVVDSHHICLNLRLQGVQYGYGQLLVDLPRAPLDLARAPVKVFGVNAAAGLYSRSLAEGLPDRAHGFFDQRFFMYYEDVDVSYRALTAGFESYCVPAARAYHMGSASTKRRGSAYSQRMVARNQAAMIIKSTPLDVLVHCAPQYARGLARFMRDIDRQQGRRAMLGVLGQWLFGLVTAPRYLGSRWRVRRAARLSSDGLMAYLGHDGMIPADA